MTLAPIHAYRVRVSVLGYEITISPADRAVPSDAFLPLTAGIEIVVAVERAACRLSVVGDASPRLRLMEQTRYAFRIRSRSVAPARAGLTRQLSANLGAAGGDEGFFLVDTGNSVGWTSLEVQAGDGDSPQALLPLWIGPRKLSADADFEWLVDDLARTTRALAFDLSGATSLPWARTAQAESYDYEDLVFLRSVLRDVEQSVLRIDRRPHDRVVRTVDWADVSLGGQIDPDTFGSLVSRPGGLGRVPKGAHVGGLSADVRSRLQTPELAQLVPLQIPTVRRPRTRNTYENQFVRHAITTFAHRAAAIADHARAKGKAALADEAHALHQRCSSLLRLSVFDGVGPMRGMFATSQVLLRDEPYAKVRRTYLEFLLAADVDWADSELQRLQEIRDVATLYEMWVFVEVVNAIVRIIDGTVQPPPQAIRQAIRVDRSGLVVDLKRGRTSGMRVDGQAGVFTVYYNRSFAPSSDVSESSQWRTRSLPLRPDVTIEIETEGSKRYVLLDAKYRVERLGQVFELPDDPTETSPTGTASTFKRDDVYKMHAYRDAIVGAHAAIAVYPGLMDVEHLYPSAAFGQHGGVGAAPLIPGASLDRSMLERTITLACGLAA